MIISLCIVVVLIGITVAFWTETARLQKNIDLLNNYAFLRLSASSQSNN
jgi:hypothetical protein